MSSIKKCWSTSYNFDNVIVKVTNNHAYHGKFISHDIIHLAYITEAIKHDIKWNNNFLEAF